MLQRIHLPILAATVLLLSCTRESGVVVARVGNQVLTRADLEQQLSPELARHADKSVYLDLARRWMRSKLLAKEARRLDLDNEKDVRKRLRDREDEVLAELLLSRVLDSVPEASPSEIHKYYENHPDEFLRVEPEIAFRRIRFPDLPTALSRTRTLTATTFAAEAARQNDGGNGDGQRLWRRSELPAGTADILFALQEGSISEPVQTPEGWTLFLLVSRSPAGSIRPFNDVVDLIRLRLAEADRRRRLDDLVARLSRQGDAEILTQSLPGADTATATTPRN
ncbi:MAG: peptidyl-prolyl cis-trans isomerase [Fibrobacteria bacterium]|nr:peptidyl-prolyl cis-trans isomerase [Fibrobacteria bacterium]